MNGLLLIFFHPTVSMGFCIACLYPNQYRRFILHPLGVLCVQCLLESSQWCGLARMQMQREPSESGETTTRERVGGGGQSVMSPPSSCATLSTRHAHQVEDFHRKRTGFLSYHSPTSASADLRYHAEARRHVKGKGKAICRGKRRGWFTGLHNSQGKRKHQSSKCRRQ